jgi:hypothetical protein
MLYILRIFDSILWDMVDLVRFEVSTAVNMMIIISQKMIIIMVDLSSYLLVV